MKKVWFFLLLLLLVSPALAKESREEKQARLDLACEDAREKKLAPLRSEYIEECITNKERPNREECVIYYENFGAQSGRKAPRFYELPECVIAFDYKQGRSDPSS